MQGKIAQAEDLWPRSLAEAETSKIVPFLPVVKDPLLKENVFLKLV